MNKKLKIILILSFSFLFLFSFSDHTLGRKNVNYWYIKDFQTTLTLNKDSTLLVEEKITADCGNAIGKHGIFRIIPTRNKRDEKEIITPIELISITDFRGNPLEYSTINDYGNGTVTWKIGDPDKTVQGVNDYKIVYEVKNVIRPNESNDLFHWNILGSFWELEIDNFDAEIILPTGIAKEDVGIDYFSGFLGSRDNYLASYRWEDDNRIAFYSHRTIQEKEGLTVKIEFPKNTFEPYNLSFWEETRKDNLWFVIPIFAFLFLLIIWNKYGRDPRAKKALTPFYEAPENLSPIEMGMLMTNGYFNKKLIPATVVNFAVKRIISIEKIEESSILKKDDFLLRKEESGRLEEVSLIEKLVFKRIFNDKDQVKISSLKRKFPSYIKEIDRKTEEVLISKGLFSPRSFRVQGLIGIFIFILTFLIVIFGSAASLFPIKSPRGIISIFAAYTISIIFLIFMPKKTIKGADLLWKIKGYEFYMKIAEKYRQKFYEKENIFEKHLPYAIVFGITDLWVKKMKKIYGEDYFKEYHPAWLRGADVSQFNIDSFVSELNSLSKNISRSTGTSDGTGGGSGGGGGGGW